MPPAWKGTVLVEELLPEKVNVSLGYSVRRKPVLEAKLTVPLKGLMAAEVLKKTVAVRPPLSVAVMAEEDVPRAESV